MRRRWFQKQVLEQEKESMGNYRETFLGGWGRKSYDSAIDSFSKRHIKSAVCRSALLCVVARAEDETQSVCESWARTVRSFRGGLTAW